MVCKYFLPVCRWSFYFVDGFLFCAKVLIWIRSHLSIFAFGTLALENLGMVYTTKYFAYVFLLGVLWFHVLYVSLQTIFEFTFLCDIRECCNFIDLHAAVQLSQHHLLKKLSFLHCIFLSPLLKINWPQCVSLFWLSYSVPLIHVSICLCQYHAVWCFDYCSFVVLSEVWEGYITYFVLFPQDRFGNSGSFMVPYKV